MYDNGQAEEEGQEQRHLEEPLLVDDLTNVDLDDLLGVVRDEVLGILVVVPV